MSNEIDTSVHVVFKQHTIPKNNNNVNNFDMKCEDIVKEVTKQSLRTKIEVMRAEYKSANDKRNFELSRLLKTVEKSNAQEHRKIETFLDNVESVMKIFSNELKSLENTYNSIMKRLPPES